MATRLSHLVIDATDPAALSRFWAEALGWRVVIDDPHEVEIAGGEHDLDIIFVPVPEPKSWKNRLHLELVSESIGNQGEMVDRLLSLGAHHVDIGQTERADHTVLADPEGNEFCVGVRGDFLATTGLVGAVTFEPAHPVVGYFWSEATGWPIVYDRDGDTAIRHPSGRGPFITFGPPVRQNKPAKNRLHLDVAPPADGDLEAEVDQLIAAGARRIDIGQRDVPWVVLADPEGNEFCVLTPR
jgi:catechol 2,3-dioxygenase-like lactoylglutathione lyase family enzyme